VLELLRLSAAGTIEGIVVIFYVSIPEQTLLRRLFFLQFLQLPLTGCEQTGQIVSSEGPLRVEFGEGPFDHVFH
jgi:hypothetical protein